MYGCLGVEPKDSTEIPSLHGGSWGGVVMVDEPAAYRATVECLVQEALRNRLDDSVAGLLQREDGEYQICRTSCTSARDLLDAMLQSCDVVVFDSVALGARVAVFPKDQAVVQTGDFDALFVALDEEWARLRMAA